MYAITFHLYPNGPINTDIYTLLAETYHLPSIESLLISLEQEIEWASVEKEVQVYFLDNLREVNQRNLFQIRFQTRSGAHELTALFMSVNEAHQVHTLSLQFPSRGDRHCSANIIGWLKEMARTSGTTIEFELSGYHESDRLHYIRERSLSAFQWHAELKRYLHTRDKPWEVKEVKKGMTRL